MAGTLRCEPWLPRSSLIRSGRSPRCETGSVPTGDLPIATRTSSRGFKAISPSFVACLGWTAQSIAALKAAELIHPDDAESSRTLLEGMPRPGMSVVEVRCRHRDGSYRWIAWSFTVDDQLVYASGRDFTHQKGGSDQTRADRGSTHHLARCQLGFRIYDLPSELLGGRIRRFSPSEIGSTRQAASSRLASLPTPHSVTEVVFVWHG